MLLVLALVVPLLLGHAALRVLVDGHARALAGKFVCLASAIPLGIGLTSVLYFAVAFALGPELWKTTLAEMVVLAVLAWHARRRPRDARSVRAAQPIAPVWLRACVVLGTIGAAASFATQVREFPFGDADGVAIWGNRAIFLVRAFGDWPLVFSPELVHTDYPLLVPLSLMRMWAHTGNETPLAGVILAAAFTACTFAALGGCVTRLRGGALAALATLGLCATPFFAVQGAGQTGDVPLACYVLLAAAWFRLAEPRGAMICGVFACLAAWTKNEGGLVAAAMLFWVVVHHARAQGARAALRALALWLAGGVPMLAAIAAFKIGLAPANDLVANHDLANVLPMLTSATRWEAVGRAFADLLIWFRGAGAVAGFGPVMLVGVAWLFWRQRAGRFFSLEVCTALSVAAAEFVVFLLSPYDLRWHLSTALDRLLLQVWPLTLLGVALALRLPQRPLPQRRFRQSSTGGGACDLDHNLERARDA